MENDKQANKIPEGWKWTNISELFKLFGEAHLPKTMKQQWEAFNYCY